MKINIFVFIIFLGAFFMISRALWSINLEKPSNETLKLNNVNVSKFVKSFKEIK